MMSRRKIIAVFGALWIVLVGVLIGIGVFGGESGKTNYGREDMLVSVTGTGVTAGTLADSGAPDAGAAARDTEKAADESSEEPGSEDATATFKKGDAAKTSSGKSGDAHVSKDSSGKKGGASNSSGGSGAKEKSDPAASPSPTATAKSKQETFSFTIECKRILDKKDLWRDGLEEVIPKSGVFFSGNLTYKKGESVYEALKRICEKHDILLDSKFTPLYDTYYVSGIGNLYEFDCGSESGWKYSVNGKLPGVGCSKYSIQKGDKVVFFYDYEI